MSVKSSKVNNSKKIIKSDTVYMNTDSLNCINNKNKKNIGCNIKNIIISKNLVEVITDYIEIYNSSANNLYFEGFPNFGEITIPIDYFLEESLNLEIVNKENIKCNFRKVNIVKDNKLISEIYLEDNIKEIEICESDVSDNLDIKIITNNKIIKRSVDDEGKYFKTLYRYDITIEDLDEFNNLELNDILDYNYILCDKININTLIVDKRIFNKLNTINSLFQKNANNPNIKSIRIIDNNEMRLLPFDKTFEIKNILFYDDDYNKYIYIETYNDEVILYMDKNNKLNFISKNELLKEKNLKNVYFRFRKQTNINGGTLKPLSLIIKEYNDDNLKVFDLKNELNIDENFKTNIILNIEKLRTNIEELNYIKNNKWLTLLNSINFSNHLYKQMLSIHYENERIKKQAEMLGLSSAAINYLKSRGILDSVVNKKLIQFEVEGFNEIGEKYKKLIKK